MSKLLVLVLTFICCVSSAEKSGESGKYRSIPVENLHDTSIYTSIAKLEQFFMEEVEYVNDLRAISEKKLMSAEAVGHLGTYVASYEDILADQEEDPSFVHNPINAYMLVRHVAIGWNIVVNVIQDQKAKLKEGQKLPKRVRKVLARSKRKHIPGEQDMDGVSMGIIRLHDTYRFNTTELVARGIFQTDDVTTQDETQGLTVWDAFKIGVKGANVLFLGSGIDLMQSALEMAKVDGITSPPFVEALDMKTLKNLIKTAKTVHDQKLDRWGPRTMQHSTHDIPYDRRLAKKKKFQKVTDEKPKAILNNHSVSQEVEMNQSIRLCRGEELRPPSVTKSLQCRYASRGVPYGPRKIEVVSEEPHIAVMHDFIMDSEINSLLGVAQPKLRRSMTASASQNASASGEDRVSNTAWITEDMNPGGAGKLTQRIDTFLNLEATSFKHSESYQVVNYGVAGQYDSHYDQTMMGSGKIVDLQKRIVFNREAGDRMATIMGYLSDVTAGGYTVFPTVGAKVKPRRGSVVVWWNMDKAGGYDNRTRHAGCPVIVGSKWITNKWIRINSQMFKRPCPKYTNRQLREFRSTKLKRGEYIKEP